MFYIEIVGLGPLKEQKTGKTFSWDAGEEAQAEAKMLNEQAKENGDLVRYRVKKDTSDIPRNPRWRERERKRFEDGTYQCTPWSHLYDLFKEEHYVHLSLDQPGYIAYFPSVERGEQDRPERCSAGRYLNKYFGPDNLHPRLNYEQIRDLSNKVFAFSKKLKVEFATTPKEIERVYARSVRMCVSPEQARAYGAGDLAIAYLEDDGAVVARSVCWPEKQRFGRIYPEDRGKYYMELKQQLETKGWKYFKPDEFGLYFGARLLTKARISNQDVLENIRYTCPHLDHAYFVKPVGDYLVICEDQGLNARTTGSGYARGFKCDKCGDYGCMVFMRPRQHGGTDNIPGGAMDADHKRICARCLKKKIRARKTKKVRQ